MNRILGHSMISACLLVGGQATMPAQDAVSPALRHARELLRKTILIDGHNDLPWAIRMRKEAPMDIDAVDLRRAAHGDTDIPRLREGGVGGQFWSVFVPGNLAGGQFARVTLEQLDLARRVIAKYPDDLEFSLTAADVTRAHGRGRIASLLGLEGGHIIENSLGTLRAYYALGARYMTLTHNVTLDWADAASGTPRHDGLTPFGKEVVREMNRLGMLVDISHVTPKTMADALGVSEAPVIFSHSSARALTDHPRNVPDDIAVRLAANGGVIMVTFVPPFVSQQVADWWAPVFAQFASAGGGVAELRKARTAEAGPPPRSTLAQVADHIDHLRKVAGVDHIGIASDFGEPEETTQGLEDVSKYPDLFAELIRRGWSDADLSKLAGGNTLRVMRDAEAVARRLQAARPASIATLESLDGPRPSVLPGEGG